jgi:hypothetical protein
MQIRVKEDTKEFGTCGCGRSPTGNCIGWHGLTTEQYEIELSKYNDNLKENKEQGISDAS